MAGEHHDEAPVIRIVKKISHGGHHGGAWKVAYADFVTAMMALFIVLWILGQSEETKQGIAGYFRDPSGVGGFGAGALGKQSRMTMSSQTTNHGADATVLDMKGDPLQQLEKEADKLKEMIEQQPDLKALSGQISVEVTPEGVRVEINESEKAALFESGSAKLSSKLTQALSVLGAEYRKVSSMVVIEGHTDSAPYAPGSTMTNWELSTQRAMEARRALMDGGLPEQQVYMIRGFADRRPRFDNASDPRNRRISMLLLSPEGLRIASGQTHVVAPVAGGGAK
ncbi:MAG TPA: flagellar motor protein MotB [bacterium]|jgi:chemotaxis protein MotB